MHAVDYSWKEMLLAHFHLRTTTSQETKIHISMIGNYNIIIFYIIKKSPIKGGWATPSCSARLGWPMGQVKQASDLVPQDKNSVNSLGEIPLLEPSHSKEQYISTWS